MNPSNFRIQHEPPFFVAQGIDIDISSFGETAEEAACNFREAIELHFENDPPNTDLPTRDVLR